MGLKNLHLVEPLSILALKWDFAHQSSTVDNVGPQAVRLGEGHFRKFGKVRCVFFF